MLNIGIDNFWVKLTFTLLGGIEDDGRHQGPTKRVSKASLSGYGLKWSNVGDLLYARFRHSAGVRKAQTGIEVYFYAGGGSDDL